MKLNEVETDFDTPTDFESDFADLDDLLKDVGNEPETDSVPAQAEPKQKPAQQSKLKQAGAAKTRAKMGGIAMSASAMNQLSSLVSSGMVSSISDAAALQLADMSGGEVANALGFDPTIEPTTANLPAVVNKSIAKFATDIANVNPEDVEWNQVKHLPGFLQQPIRAMGEKVFAPFTSCPLNEIQVIADVGGGPNSEGELSLVANWLQQYVAPDHTADINFSEIIPGYNAKSAMYNIADYTFMLVQDEHGSYVYSWPAKYTKNADFKGVPGLEHNVNEMQKQFRTNFLYERMLNHYLSH